MFDVHCKSGRSVVLFSSIDRYPILYYIHVTLMNTLILANQQKLIFISSIRTLYAFKSNYPER